METPKASSNTIEFTCSCGAQEALPASLRGIEQSCAECGRIFRIPTTGMKLDLREDQSAANQQIMAELKALAGPEQQNTVPRRTLLAMIVWQVLGLAVLGLLVYFILLKE